MQVSTSPNVQRSKRPAFSAPAAWLVLDSLAAAGFAGGLAVSLAGAASGSVSHLCAGLALIVLSAIGRSELQVRAQRAGIAAAIGVKQAARGPLFRATLTMNGSARRLVGEELAVAVDRVADLSGYHSTYVPQRQAAVVAPLAVAALVALASPVSAAILIATLVPFAFGMALAGGAARRAADAQVSALARLSGLFVDRVRSLRMILAFGAETRVGRQVDATVHQVADRTYAVLRTAFLSSATIEFFSALSVALVAVYCGFNLLRLLPFPVGERLDLSRAIFALALAPEFYLPLRRLAAAYHDKQVGEAAAAAIAQRQSEALPPIVPARDLSLDNLTVQNAVVDYGGGRRLGPFDISVGKGELVALTGPTGSGKTSLLHMIVGLAPLGAGELLSDGARIVPGAANNLIGWAGQHVVLLPGSIADNVALADPAASRQAVAEAATSAGLDPLIASRPQGLDTSVDFRGSGLSGGERRRIAIARALLANRPFLLLDEPTADLDAVTAASIIALLRLLRRTHAILVATHDVALIAAATREVSIA